MVFMKRYLEAHKISYASNMLGNPNLQLANSNVLKKGTCRQIANEDSIMKRCEEYTRLLKIISECNLNKAIKISFDSKQNFFQ